MLRTVDALGRRHRRCSSSGTAATKCAPRSPSRPSLEFVVQSPQLGTGHASAAGRARAGRQVRHRAARSTPTSRCSRPARFGAWSNTITRHARRRTVLTAELDDPYGYGRIVRDADGRISRIVEERDASGAERAIREINSGIYALDLAPLFPALHSLASDNAQGEYYLTDLVATYRQQGRRVETLCLDSSAELRGVNSRVDLAELGQVVRARKNRQLMLDGVTLEDPATTYVDADVTIGADTIIAPGAVLEGTTTIGRGCRLRAGVRVTNATIGDDVTILDRSVIVDSRVASGAQIGPFAHVRPGSEVAEDARVGNFVELKKTTLGRGSKANHLAYLGDATIGEHVNIGAGTITCNYDGVNKHPTIIENDVFIGSDSQLIAPVRVGRGAYVAAGSSITEDVPADALAIARGRQENKADWAAKRRALKKPEKH